MKLHEWIPCEKDNLPPAEIPDGMLMAVWVKENSIFSECPLWIKKLLDVNRISHYPLVPKPEGRSDPTN